MVNFTNIHWDDRYIYATADDHTELDHSKNGYVRNVRIDYTNEEQFIEGGITEEDHWIRKAMAGLLYDFLEDNHKLPKSTTIAWW